MFTSPWFTLKRPCRSLDIHREAPSSSSRFYWFWGENKTRRYARVTQSASSRVRHKIKHMSVWSGARRSMHPVCFREFMSGWERRFEEILSWRNMISVHWRRRTRTRDVRRYKTETRNIFVYEGNTYEKEKRVGRRIRRQKMYIAITHLWRTINITRLNVLLYLHATFLFVLTRVHT